MSHPSALDNNSSARPALDETRISEEASIAVVEESLTVTKQAEVTGRVRISKTVETESVPFELATTHRSYDVSRRSVGELREECPPATRLEGVSTVYSVVREVPVVVTRYELVEEIVVTPREETEQKTEVVDRRVERVDIEREPAD